ncbi:tyrosine-type recombinase/integrase [Oculatella sp. FACHB-28]|uniref:tyrosine-type recombinase/integrase n=1 Tax=Oculatella sp. FACHB-28 TaxID=2692845 RepID=UPI001688E6C9|nr:tyrosine-type recombinase/integrase [Oculatella sp. FACHB-28]MBD2054651.1 tyrosine-type recombinase/integrase [Oculatella sp. FACHB-28]
MAKKLTCEKRYPLLLNCIPQAVINTNDGSTMLQAFFYGKKYPLFCSLNISMSKITLPTRNGILQYSFSRKLSRELFNQEQYRISAQLENTPENRIKAEGVIREMILDALAGHFDKSLAKYGLKKQKEAIQSEKPFSLSELIEKRLDFKVLAQSTLKSKRRLFSNILTESQTTDPNELFNWTKKNRAASTAEDFFSFMKDATDWAIVLGRSPFGERNPFIGILIEAKKLPKGERKPKKGFVPGEREDTDPEEFEDCRAFSAEEREIILQAFLQSTYSFIVPFLRFLFLTGCRPGEACEVRWKDIFLDLKTCTGRITFSRAYSPEGNEIKCTKTGVKRKFPIRDPRLFDLLRSIQPTDAKPDDLVFTWRNGDRVKIRSLARIWGAANHNGKIGIVLQLANEGKLRTYLRFYACRHTFITLQLFAGPKNVVISLAKWVGNSPETIYKHYADASEEIFPMEV